MARAPLRRGPARQTRATTVSITCLIDGHAHDVPDIELVGSDSRRPGQYLAVCGHLVAAASLVQPDGAPCILCNAL